MTSIAYGRGRDAGDRVLRTAARGGILIGVAVVIGIILLQVVDNANPGSSSSQSNGSANHRTTTTKASEARPPEEVQVAVYNASGVAGAAQETANRLTQLGYITGTVGNASDQAGTTVQCQAGYEEEAKQLAAIPELAGANIVSGFAPPADAGNANCVIILGQG